MIHPSSMGRTEVWLGRNAGGALEDACRHVLMIGAPCTGNANYLYNMTLVVNALLWVVLHAPPTQHIFEVPRGFRILDFVGMGPSPAPSSFMDVQTEVRSC